MTELAVNIERTINSSIEKVFDAWLNPKLLAQFMTPMPGMPDSVVSNDPRVGGRFSVIMYAGDKELPHTGEYLEIERPEKLVFTWSSQHSLDDSVVTLTFATSGDNATIVTLSHVKFIDEEARANHEGGWAGILNKLNDVVG